MKSPIVTIIVLLLTNLALAAEPHQPPLPGGNGSGGGNFEGKQAALSLSEAITDINNLRTKLLTPDQLKSVNDIAPQIKVLGVDFDLPASIDGVIQKGFAYSFRGQSGPLTLVNVKKWKATTDPLDRKSGMAHELFVLLMFESTGDYTLSNRYTEFLKNPGKTLANEAKLSQWVPSAPGTLLVGAAADGGCSHPDRLTFKTNAGTPGSIVSFKSANGAEIKKIPIEGAAFNGTVDICRDQDLQFSYTFLGAGMGPKDPFLITVTSQNDNYANPVTRRFSSHQEYGKWDTTGDSDIAPADDKK